ncbi:class F sortase [Streptomonospora litoralis]|uniref:Sortase family protein n=1 Tax=Streptomonospora litoralis TaxID=2498135 RepID=A0A4V0ZJI5_9ACTN|nr:class F sortase [Streptomonospora litoralis]QBI53602.1 Sortase family protein [Streptomonospora litoralis]
MSEEVRVRQGGRRTAPALAGLGVAALLMGAATFDAGSAPLGPVPEPPAVPGPQAPAMERARPVSLGIPALELHTRRLTDLGLTGGGRLEAPGPWQAVGWYTAGPAPGEEGAAVLAGHVDSRSGPAVFFGLELLEPGHRIRIGRADGTTARFAVERVEQYAKDDFPARRVYGPTGGSAELRLITCGGAFDSRTGHYRANTVVYARLIG